MIHAFARSSSILLASSSGVVSTIEGGRDEILQRSRDRQVERVVTEVCRAWCGDEQEGSGDATVKDERRRKVE